MSRIQKTEALRKAEAVSRLKKTLFPVVGLVLLIMLAILATSWGAASITAEDVVKAVMAKLFPFSGATTSRLADTIIWSLRLPRITMAIVAGAGFAISGAAMQGILRNPLVSPFTIGISSGAGFGASLAIILGLGFVGAGKYLIIGNAFFFAIISACLVYGVARLRGVSPETLILGGIALMYLFSASTSLLQFIATEQQLQGVVFWLFGSLSSATWSNLAIVTIVFIICFPLLLKYSWDLNALATGDDVATSLGINPDRIRMVVMILSSLMTATIICFTGIIGFVCLVAPHITRMIIGSDHRFLIPFASIIGAILLLAADTLGRTAFVPTEIPVGIVTAFIGVPMFLYLLITRRRQYFK
ncbi:MAG: iron ABC transporter permease [Desulfobacteraceae bacterium]|jgi:iron complex transport system permease protein